MDRSYKFAILQASPDAQRGERVNVGVVVATPNGLDVRVPELRKLRGLTGHGWDSVVDAYTRQLGEAWEVHGDLAGLSETPGGMSQVFALGAPGTLLASDTAYEERIQSILRFLVVRPVLSRREKQERINTEVARVLKQAGVLGGKGQTIDDHKVVSRFVVSEEKDIVADFAYKATSNIKVVSTLDLRGSKSAHGKACEKGATLYFAKKQFGPTMEPFGIYAASPVEADAHKGEVDILTSFAEGNTFNWMVAADRQRFQHAFY
jgi:hypothetical protein